MKTCKKCNKTLTLDNFYDKPYGKLGKNAQCIDCVKAYNNGRYNRKRIRFEWTPQKEKYLEWHYKNMKNKEMAKALGCSVSAIKNRAAVLGLRKRRDWKEEEIQYLKDHYPTTETRLIADHLDISMGRIYSKVNRLGLKKSKKYLDKHVYTADGELGKKTRFKKGHVPWSKGKKLPTHPNSRKYLFQKGHRPHNTKEDGTISIRDINGKPYQFIRISLNNWKLYHRHIWENQHGPIPEGMHCSFKDGNTMNCEIENLELITRGEMMNRNTISQYPLELQQTIRSINILNKKINDHAS